MWPSGAGIKAAAIATSLNFVETAAMLFVYQQFW